MHVLWHDVGWTDIDVFQFRSMHDFELELNWPTFELNEA